MSSFLRRATDRSCGWLLVAAWLVHFDVGPRGYCKYDRRPTLRNPSTPYFAISQRRATPPALRSEKTDDGRATFETLPLAELVDCPLIAGEHLRTITLNAGENPPAFLDLVSELRTALQIGSNVVNLYSRLVKQAGAVFGTFHYPEFHFLVTVRRARISGLEHLTSSLNGVDERDLIGDPCRQRTPLTQNGSHEE